jgi:hypothetical protein
MYSATISGSTHLALTIGTNLQPHYHVDVVANEDTGGPVVIRGLASNCPRNSEPPQQGRVHATCNRLHQAVPRLMRLESALVVGEGRGMAQRGLLGV